MKQFFFSSSVAACELPPRGKTLDETSPPDGRHVYAQTKRIGETMVGGYKDRFTPVIVRFAAMFSDWCEYPPLYMFLETWLSNAWNRHDPRRAGARARSRTFTSRTRSRS